MKDYYILLIIVFIFTIMINYCVPIMIKSMKVKEFCNAMFSPENSTKNFDQYIHCTRYPETYGYGKK